MSEPAPSAGKTPPSDAESGSGSIFLSELQVEATRSAIAWLAEAPDDAAFSQRLSVNIEVLGSERRFGELTRRSKQFVQGGKMVLGDLLQLESKDKPSSRDQKSSFIVDFEEASVKAVAERVKGRAAKPTAAQLEAFTSRVIEHKTYVRSFDVASRVAENHAGDCTEHAVLAAALLRYFGYPARVVLGAVLVGVRREARPPSLLAAGHAWVEYYDRGRWRVLDAALRADESSDKNGIGVPGLPDGVTIVKAYLPINVLENESASYARALMNERGIEAVLRISVDTRR